MKAFKKNETATYIASWDDKGTFYYTHAVIVSCGAKQMTLQNAKTGDMMGRNFEPVAGSLGATRQFSGVFHRLSDEAAAAKCLELAADFLLAERAHFDARIAQWGDDPRFKSAMEKGRAELHEPRAMVR